MSIYSAKIKELNNEARLHRTLSPMYMTPLAQNPLHFANVAVLSEGEFSVVPWINQKRSQETFTKFQVVIKNLRSFYTQVT